MKMDVIVLKDGKTNTYIAFVKKFPSVVIQADDKKDIPVKIQDAWKVFLAMLIRQQEFKYSEAELV